jgi:hypothetical protein
MVRYTPVKKNSNPKSPLPFLVFMAEAVILSSQRLMSGFAGSA